MRGNHRGRGNGRRGRGRSQQGNFRFHGKSRNTKQSEKSKVCQVCHEQNYKYTCPKTKTRYCSVACFKMIPKPVEIDKYNIQPEDLELPDSDTELKRTSKKYSRVLFIDAFSNSVF